jgi:tetratricopeptide (TPR) repeat protein
MNQLQDNMPTSSARLTRWRLAAIAGCIGAAFAAAVFVRQLPAPKSSDVALTGEQILAQIPMPTGTSAAALGFAEALSKVRSKIGDVSCWVNLGDTLAQMLRDTSDEKYYDFAETAYQYAIQLRPDTVDALIGMAWVSGGRHQFDQSRAWANRALAIDAENAAAFGILGDAALELGDYDNAYEHYQKMMDLKPDLSSWSRGAHLLHMTGETTSAISLMEKAIKAGAPFAENTAWCRAKLAMMLFSQGALLPAAQVLEQPLKSGSKNSHVLLAAGRIAAAREDYTAAEKYYRTVLDSGPNHEAFVALGDLCAVRGDNIGAEKYYDQVEALEAAQKSRTGHSHMAMSKFYADHDRKLIEALRMAEARKLTRNINEADTLAWVYFKNGDQSRAIEAIKRALSHKTQEPEIHFHAGMIAAKFGDRASAQNHLQQALNLNPRFSILQAPVAIKMLEQLSGSSPSTAVAIEKEGAAR